MVLKRTLNSQKSSAQIATAVNLFLVLLIGIFGAFAKHIKEGAPLPAWLLLLGLHRFQLLVSCGVIFFGGLAVLAKRLNQIAFGGVEVIFSVTSAWILVPGIFNRDAVVAHWVGLVGAVYVAARGIGNILEGYEKYNAPKKTSRETS